MGTTLHRLLKAVRDHRREGADPHVLLTPRVRTAHGPAPPVLDRPDPP